MVPGTVGLALLALASIVGLSQSSGFTERGLSLLSYQLCSYRETHTISRVEAVQTSHVTFVPCGGWIPWRQCPKTVYGTQYVTVEVPESRNVTHCCEGYEQLGLYCVLHADCPGLRKCCPGPGGHRCEAPVPQDVGSTTKRHLVSWYNVTVRVKVGFEDLRQVDPELRNHTHLLCSLVTSALQPLDSTVHYLDSAGGDASTTVSWLLLGLPQMLPVANVTTMLEDIMKRVCEVVSIQVQDMDECVHTQLHTCSGGQHCHNTEGSYQCVGPPKPASSPQTLSHSEEGLLLGLSLQFLARPQEAATLCLCPEKDAAVPLSLNVPSRSYVNASHLGCQGLPYLFEATGRCRCYCPPLCDYMILNVTSSSFQVSWRENSSQSRAVLVQVYRGGEMLWSAWSRAPLLQVSGLEAGVLYKVKSIYQGCSDNTSAMLLVKTDAQVFEVVVRIVDRNLTEALLNLSSGERRDFSRQLLREVESSFPPAVSDLHRRGKLRLEIMSLRAGSVVVSLRVTVQDPIGVSTLAPMLRQLSQSSVFQIDPQGTQVRDWDECAHSSEHDCSPAADCINLEGSYTCRCRTARDTNPARVGRACEGDMVNPTGAGPSASAEVTASALGPGLTTLVPHIPTLSLSPRNSWSSPAEGQAWTPEPSPRKGASGTVGYERNSAGQSVGEGVPSVAPAPGTSHGSAGGVASSASSPSAPVPTHSYPQSPPGSPLDPPGQLVCPQPSYLSPVVTPSHLPDKASPPALTPPSSSLFQLTSPSVVPQQAVPQLSRTPPTVIVSNVTSTGFHLRWEADLTLRPTFHLAVVSPRSPAVSQETLDANMTLSGLEPGVLYLVEIVADTCGRKGPRMQLKVRTAAQKLSGKVRVTNVRYSESLCNASSVEYRDFVQLFLRMVRDSLPAPLRQHVDDGGIRVNVTSVSNSSGVVVEFNLLVTRNVDMDVGQVSAVFLAALRNASRLEVVAGDTVIWDKNTGQMEPSRVSVVVRGSVKLLQVLLLLGLPRSSCPARLHGLVAGLGCPALQAILPALGQAPPGTVALHGLRCRIPAQQNLLNPHTPAKLAVNYDECEGQEDDCGPGTSCANTLGSFTCRCKGTAPDFPVEYSGRPCDGGSPGNSTQTPGPGQPPALAGTTATLLQGTSAVPRGLAPWLNLTGAVQVLCEVERVAVTIQKGFLQKEAIPESSLYLGQPSCNVSLSNSTHVLLAAGWAECGTLVQSNVTSTVVKTTLRNDRAEGVIHHLKILSPIRCVFRNDLLTSLGYTPKWGVYTVMEDLHGSGNFVTEMQLFIGDSPIPQNHSVSANDDVKIEVGLYRQKSNLKVVLLECWATPSSNARDSTIFGFINNSCPIPNTYTSVIRNGDSSTAQFKLKIFSFVNNSVVYLHCRLRVCMESPEASCRINCNDFRLLRSHAGFRMQQISWGPLLRSAGTPACVKPRLGAGYVSLIVVAVCVMVAGAAALLIVRYQRVTGKYSFRIQSDDIGYQVFTE
ncbi:uromodulin-like 1 [Ctenodactylus gundi]